MRKAICWVAAAALMLSGCAAPKLPFESNRLNALAVTTPAPAPPYSSTDPKFQQDLKDTEKKCDAMYATLNDKVKASKQINVDLLLVGIGLGIVSGVVAAGNAAKIAKAFWTALATATTATATFAGTVNSDAKADASNFSKNVGWLDSASWTEPDATKAKKDLDNLGKLCDTGALPPGVIPPTTAGVSAN